MVGCVSIALLRVNWSLFGVRRSLLCMHATKTLSSWALKLVKFYFLIFHPYIKKIFSNTNETYPHTIQTDLRAKEA